MSFSENDFPGLITQLERASGAYPDPGFSLEVVKEIIRIFKRVPLYPGIAAGCSFKIVKEISPEILKEGDFTLVFPKKGQPFSGKVKSVGKDRIDLASKENIKTADVKKVLVINKKVLEEDWPTLIFPEVK
ncbi:MAG: hypothetical protein PHV06_03940 [bacterium]|mgnify:CR=1 FL=1|nr:hypothetical protein [bacterium]